MTRPAEHIVDGGRSAPSTTARAARHDRRSVWTISPPFDLLPRLLHGASITLQVTGAAALLAFFLSFVAGLSRMSKVWVVRSAAAVYVEVIRGTSLLVQLFWIYFVLPFIGIHLDTFTAGVLAVGLNYGA